MFGRGRTPFAPAANAAPVSSPAPPQTQFTALNAANAPPDGRTSKLPSPSQADNAVDCGAALLALAEGTPSLPASAPTLPTTSPVSVEGAAFAEVGPLARRSLSPYRAGKAPAAFTPPARPGPAQVFSKQQQPHDLQLKNPPIPTSLPPELCGPMGGAEDEHVTVWHPATRKTVAGNAAPYRRNLKSWLNAHPGWEEKADELKSSKRRIASRRIRNAHEAFKSLCHYPVAHVLFLHVTSEIKQIADDQAAVAAAGAAGQPSSAPAAGAGAGAAPPNVEQSAHAAEAAASDWSNDEYVRLQEALYDVGNRAHMAGAGLQDIPPGAWEHVAAAVGHSYSPLNVLYVARHLLCCGIQKARANQGHAAQSGASAASAPAGAGGVGVAHEQGAHGSSPDAAQSSVPGSGGPAAPGGGPASRSDPMTVPSQAGPSSTSAFHQAGPVPIPGLASSLDPALALPSSLGDPASLPNLDSASNFLDRTYRTPREKRVTVWFRPTGRTVSGNAAPCVKNVSSWLAAHPGWEVKPPDQLASRSKGRSSRTTSNTPPTNVLSAGVASPPIASTGSGSIGASASSLPASAPINVGIPSPTASAVSPLATPHDSPQWATGGNAADVQDAASALVILSTTPSDESGFPNAAAMEARSYGETRAERPGPMTVPGRQGASISASERANPPQFTSSVSSGSSRCAGDERMQDHDDPEPAAMLDEADEDGSGDVQMGGM